MAPLTYNGLVVPATIKPTMIISAACNEMDSDKIETYTAAFQAEMLSHSFPAIMGFPSVIIEDDLGGWFVDGREITEDCLGKVAWYVTDGHHRSIAAINAGLPYLETTLDRSTITDERELKYFDTHLRT